MDTHIDTLAHNTPKSRRRVRRTNGNKRGIAIDSQDVARAQDIARDRECDREKRDAAKRAEWRADQ